MAMHWSSWEGGTYTGFRVGVDVTVSPSSPDHSDTSVKVTLKWYVASSGSVDDDMYINKGGDASGTVNFHFSAGNGTHTKLVDTDTHTYTLSYTNTGTKTYSVGLHGVYNGASPHIDVDVNLPERPAAAPDTPSKPNIVIDGSSSLHVNWSKPDGNGDSVDLMQYQLDNSSSFSSPVDDHTDGSSPSFTSGLSKYTVYYARVRAHNSKGYGPWSAVDSARTDGTVPGKVRSLAVSSVTSSGMHASWSPPSDDGGPSVTQYFWSVATDSAGNNLVKSDSLTGRSLTVTGLNNNTRYYFRVRASNALGVSGVTVKQFQTGAGTANSPTGLTVSSVTKNSAHFVWTAPTVTNGSPVDDYTIQIATTNAFADDDLVVEDDTPDATRVYDATGLPLNTPLFSRVAANNGGGQGTWSSTTGFTTLTGVRRWNGSAWVDCTIAKRWNGTAWVNLTKVNKWNGTAWV